MFPAAFNYRAPTSLEEALELLASNGDDAKVLAGGQSLLPLMKLRFATPGLLVDIGRLSGLSGWSRDGQHLRIGALTTHGAVEISAEMRALCPLMADAAPQISDPVIRQRGTVGGSVCHADPQGDWGSVMLALGAGLRAVSKRGERVIAVDGFYLGPFANALEPDEIVTELLVPMPANPASGTYLKLERKVGDYATAAVAVQIEMAAGQVVSAGIGLTGVGASNLKAHEAERSLIGGPLSDDAIDRASRLAAAAAEPKSDIRGPAEYKRDLVRVFTKRGLRTVRDRLVAGANQER